jgi:hypothetical protein
LSAVEDLKRTTSALQEAVTALTQCISKAGDYLRGAARDLPDATMRAAAKAWDTIAEEDVPEIGALRVKVTGVRDAYASILIALSKRRVEEASQCLARNAPQEHSHALYAEAIDYAERAARVGGQGDEVRTSALDIFRNTALFFATTMHDGAGAINILERALTLFPDEQQLVNQMTTLRQLM